MSLEAFQERIRTASARRSPLRLRGGGSKDFYGNPGEGEVLDTKPYAGIVSYEPTELVVTARCGTRLAAVEEALQAQGQCLPFEPPHFGPDATFGGCVAAGLSGPRRASAGAVRDFVLGAKLVDGQGRVLVFGGQVMKNVAGYDVARLLTGSLGTLGLIAEASIKVLPRPAAEETLALALGLPEALERMNAWAGQPLPISATLWHDGQLCVRLSGSDAALRSARSRIGGEAVGPETDGLWRDVREHSHPFFQGAQPLWRIAVPSTAAALALEGVQLVEWFGGLRWLRSSEPADRIRAVAAAAGGHATLFRGGTATGSGKNAFTPLAPAALRLHRALKAVFDPAGVLNPGRMYPGM